MPFENTAEASARPITCVLIDVGGTLWPSGWSDLGAVEAARRANLAAALPELMPPRNVEFSERLAACAREPGMSGQAMTQNVPEVIRRAAQQYGLVIDGARLQAIRRALYVSPIGHLSLFPGARELLARIKEPGWRCIAVSNARWRTADDYRSDFVEMGISCYIDHIVSSVDVGFRKPHHAMFEAALAAGQCAATQCVMIGNSESKDIQRRVSLPYLVNGPDG